MCNYNGINIISPEKLLDSVPFRDVIKEVAGSTLVYAVGGCVRDFIRGKEVHDWDFVVEGDVREIALKIAQELKSAFVPLDEDYQIYRLVPRNANLNLDFALCKGTIEEDLQSRDFTINAIALDVQTGEIIDPTCGISDIKDGVVKACHKSSFTDDPLRILRAYRFKAQLHFSIDSQTREWIVALAELLSNVAYERIRDEVFKILHCKRSASIFMEMYKDGVLGKVIPELKNLWGLSQNKFHKYDVLDHSFYTLEELENLAVDKFQVFKNLSGQIENYLSKSIAGQRTRLETIKFATLLHDIGKPGVRRVKDGILYYVGHHVEGKKIWNEIANRFRLSRAEKKLGGLLIENHLQPIFLPLEKDKKKRKRGVYRFFRQTGEAAAGVILLSWADVEAGKGEALTDEMIRNHHDFSVKLMSDFFSGSLQKNPPTFLDGYEVKKILNVERGRIIGEVLSKLAERAAMGDITNVNEAINFVKKYKRER